MSRSLTDGTDVVLDFGVRGSVCEGILRLNDISFKGFRSDEFLGCFDTFYCSPNVKISGVVCRVNDRICKRRTIRLVQCD